MPTIVVYTDCHRPDNRYPDRIVSPSRSGPCCHEAMVELGERETEGNWTVRYKRCRGCGFTVRCAVAQASPGGPTTPAYRRVAVAVTGDGKRLNRSGSGFRWRYRPVAVGQWRWREEQRWTEMSIKAVPDPWADR